MNTSEECCERIFNRRRYGLHEILGDRGLTDVLRMALHGICHELNIDTPSAKLFVEKICSMEGDASTNAFESELQETVASLIPPHGLRSALERRSSLIASQIAPFVIGDAIADIGCGDGMVAWHLHGQGKKLVLVDVVRYLDPRVNLAIRCYRDGDRLPIDEMVSTSLLLTVLHHSKRPVQLLRETRRITRSRCIVIESVYGIETGCRDIDSVLCALDIERQFKYASFVDWLYNRVFHNGVPVPYNYATPKQWHQIFQATGWHVDHAISLGIDQPIVPEHHFMFTLSTV